MRPRWNRARAKSGRAWIACSKWRGGAGGGGGPFRRGARVFCGSGGEVAGGVGEAAVLFEKRAEIVMRIGVHRVDRKDRFEGPARVAATVGFVAEDAEVVERGGRSRVERDGLPVVLFGFGRIARARV